MKYFLFLLIFFAVNLGATTKTGEVIDYFALSGETLTSRPLNDIIEAKKILLSDLLDKERPSALKRLAELPKLRRLELQSCDLSGVSESDPIPTTVEHVLIDGGKVSQGTIRWLAKFPSGIDVLIATDVHGLELNFGKFSWVVFENCKISQSAAVKLVEKVANVTFKEVTLVDNK